LRDGSVLGAPALDALSSSIGGCSKLQKLSMKCLGLPLLPDALAQLPLLQHVSIEACSVTRRAVLGPEAAIGVLGRCRKLQEITLAGCELRHVPEWLAGLQDVTALQLHENYLQDLPAGKPCMGLPPALRSLNLADNRLRQLPHSIAQLSSLSQLVLDSNYLTTLPGSIWDLPALRTLSARENMLSQLPEGGAACGESCSKECAGKGTCSSSGMPCSMGGAVAAVHVAAGAAGTGPECLQPRALSTAAQPVEGFERLSAEEEDLLRAIGVLHSSGRLSGASNLLRKGAGCAGAAVVAVPCVPRHVLQRQEPCACAGSLRTLVLADNQLTELPSSFAQLSRLRELNLSKNQLRTLPDKAGIWALTGLTNLQLADNHLRKLPAGLARLQHLVELDVSGNYLSVSIAPERAGPSAAFAVAATGPVAVSAPAAVARVAGADGSSSDQAGVPVAAPVAMASGSSSIWRGPSAPAHSTAAPAPAVAPAAATNHAHTVLDTHALVTVVVEGPGAQDSTWPGGSSCGRSFRKQSRVLPCPLGQLPELQQVCLGRQQAEGSKWCGHCPLQLLLAGLFDLAERIRALAPPNHQCPVKKAAVAAVAHITAVASASRAWAARERELLERMKSEPGWVVLPAKAAPSHV
jgi:Leucine-rich repeat (LRR) protein